MNNLYVIFKTKIEYLKTSSYLMQVIETYSARILVLIIAFFTNVITTRMIGPEGRGIWALLTVIVGLGVQFGNFGIHSAIVYHLLKEPKKLPVILGNSIYSSLLLGLLANICLFFIFNFYQGQVTIDKSFWLLIFFAVPANLAYLFFQNIFLGIKNIRHYNLIELANKLLILFFTILLFLFGAINVKVLYATTVLVMIASVFYMILYLRSIARRTLFSWKYFKKITDYSYKLFLANIIYFLIQKSGLFIVQSYFDIKQLGYYSVAMTLIDVLYVLSSVVYTITFQKLAAINDYQHKWFFTFQTLKSLALVVSVLCIFVYIGGNFIVGILYGKEFLPTVQLLHWSLPILFFSSINNILFCFLASIAKMKFPIYASALSLLIYIALSLFLLDRDLSIYSIITANAFCFISLFFSTYIYINYYLGKNRQRLV